MWDKRKTTAGVPHFVSKRRACNWRRCAKVRRGTRTVSESAARRGSHLAADIAEGRGAAKHFVRRLGKSGRTSTGSVHCSAAFSSHKPCRVPYVQCAVAQFSPFLQNTQPSKTHSAVLTHRAVKTHGAALKRAPEVSLVI